ncbi:hypothetical protein [Paenibacillus xylanilyticus]|uniref:hypothetical protein n=1 Tax=Paenibacillus xylanilyticus TaxID=248903 RepID=UPI003AB104A0
MDVFTALEAKRKVDAEDWLTSLSVQHSTGDDMKKLVGSLRERAGMNAATKTEFDESGFEAMRRQLQHGR